MYDLDSGDIDCVHDSSNNLHTKFIPLVPHKKLETKHANYLKLSPCGKFLFVLRENEFLQKCCNQFIDIRGVYGRNSQGFSSTVLEICDCHERTKEQKRYEKIHSLESKGGNLCF